MSSWKMTLKQRRRLGELTAELDRLKKNPYVRVPQGYEAGKDEAEDDKYRAALAKLAEVLEEMDNIEKESASRT